MPTVVLLGPQRFTPTLGEAVRAAGRRGTARLGDGRVAGARGRGSTSSTSTCAERTVNLMLYARGEDVFERDPELFRRPPRAAGAAARAAGALPARGSAYAKAAVRELVRATATPSCSSRSASQRSRRCASSTTTTCARVRQVDDEPSRRRWRPARRARRSRATSPRSAHALGRLEALAIAGGHVAILLNRLRLFGLDRSCRRAAGLRLVGGGDGGRGARRAVPRLAAAGAGNAEVLEAGARPGRGRGAAAPRAPAADARRPAARRAARAPLRAGALRGARRRRRALRRATPARRPGAGSSPPDDGGAPRAMEAA